jgi:hypothetical protein
MSKCPHELWERESDVTADGSCPICLRAEVERLKEELENERGVRLAIERTNVWSIRAVKAEQENERLKRAEIAWHLAEADNKRLRSENEKLRRWKAMDKPITAAMAVVSNDVQRLKAQNTEVAAFLDALAERLTVGMHTGRNCEAAADCRAMAKKLRSET